MKQWSRELKTEGFRGVDLAFDDSRSREDGIPAVLVATTESPTPLNVSGLLNDQSLVVLTGWDDHYDSPLVQITIARLREFGLETKTTSNFHEAASGTSKDKIIVIIQDCSWPSLESLDPGQYKDFQKILSLSRHVLWIVETSHHPGKIAPVGLVQGLTRALRMENQDLILAMVGIDFSLTETLSRNLKGAVGNFCQGIQTGVYERELIQDGELLNIPRLYQSCKMNQTIHEITSGSVEKKQKFGERNVKLKIRQPGLLDTLYFEEVTAPDTIAPGEVDVEVRAVGVNFKDCLTALGRVSEDTFGNECAGVVIRAGSDCRMRVGTRVLVAALDTYQTIVRCQEKLVVEIPEDMPFSHAGALVVNFLTAYHSLATLARLSPGESVLIHSGSGGTGQAAIQVAKYHEAEIYSTVGSLTKKDLLVNLYGIPGENILSSRSTSFAEGIKRLTTKGVDVVLNSLAGDALMASWDCVAPYGRFIEIGKKDIFSHNKLPMFQFARNVSFSAVDVGAMVVERPDLIHRTLETIVDLFKRKIFCMPSPIKAFPVSEVEAAFRYLQSGTNAGKVVVEIDPETVISVSVRSFPGLMI